MRDDQRDDHGSDQAAELTRKEIVWLAATAPDGRDDGAIRLRLAGLNLAGVNLSGLNLSHADFSRSNLRGCDLRGCDLAGCHFYGTDLTDADLSGARLEEGVVFSSARLARAKLAGVHALGADVEGCDLSGADLTDACFDAARFLGSMFAGARLVRTSVRCAAFGPADLREASVEGGDWSELLDEGLGLPLMPASVEARALVWRETPAEPGRGTSAAARGQADLPAVGRLPRRPAASLGADLSPHLRGPLLAGVVALLSRRTQAPAVPEAPIAA